MAYQKIRQTILSGGLNLLFPPDQIGDDESQELLNFSQDSYGSLRSRRGHTLRYSVGGKPVTMTYALGAVWIAAGGAVYRNGASVISGVSADLVGLVGFQSYLWAMSAADQRKSTGANNLRWIPEPPETAPTIKPAGAVETTVVDFTGGFTVDPAGDEVYNPTLQINAQTEAEYSATKDVSLDLRTGFSLDDVFQVTMWCKQWKKVLGVTFQIDVNDGAFTTDYYTAEMKQAEINAGHKEEVTFYLRKRPLPVDTAAKDKFRYGAFMRIGSTPEKDYRSCVKVRVKVDLSDSTKIRFISWKMVGDEENTLEGDDFRVYYTHDTDDGHESNPSPASEPIAVNRSGIVVEGMAESGDAQVTGQNIYVTGGTLGRVYRANDDPVDATTYTITDSDDDLTNRGLKLENTHDDPPVVGGLAGPFYGRLIAFGGSKIYWSHVSKPYAFKGPELLDGDWVAVDEAVGDLLAATVRPGVMFLYGTNGVVMAQGDLGDLQSAVHATAIKMGIQSSRAVYKSARGDFAQMHKGVYLCTGDAAELLSKKINPVFESFDASEAAVGFHNDVLWVSDGVSTYRLDLQTGRWLKDSRLFSCFFQDGDTLLGGTPAGQILELESGVTDAGAAFDVAWKSKAYGAAIDNESTFEDLTIFADTGGATLTVQAYLNDGRDDQQIVALGTIQSTSEQRFVLQFNDAFGIKARNCAIRITGSVSAECVIYKAVLNYYFEARQAKSFDSDEKDFGTHKVKKLRQVYVDLQNSAAANLILQSDQPGFAIATRDSSHSFAAEATRRGDMYVLQTDIKGHNLRFLLDGADFRLYGMRALIQIIGTFLHGEKDDFWDSDVLDFGSERVKLYKEIEVVYATEGSAELTMKTELPDGSLAAVTGSPFTLGPTSGEETRKIRLRPETKGRLCQFRITPTGDFQLEAVRVFLKMVGAPNATAWGWVDLGVEKSADGRWVDVFIAPDAIG